jgi:hypothetical protein
MATNDDDGPMTPDRLRALGERAARLCALLQDEMTTPRDARYTLAVALVALCDGDEAEAADIVTVFGRFARAIHQKAEAERAKPGDN